MLMVFAEKHAQRAICSLELEAYKARGVFRNVEFNKDINMVKRAT